MNKGLEKIKKLYSLLSPCKLCPLECGVLRLNGEVGACNSKIKVKISAGILYPWEEPPLSGRYGSGTIFFSNCNLKCIYCQNFQFSQLGKGKEVSLIELSQMMLSLQEKNASNINLVTPTQYFPQAIAALNIARKNGLRIPSVLNTSGYESVPVLKLLEGYIDIFLPDFRYINNEKAFKYSGVKNYVSITAEAIKEMLRQAPEVKYNREGIIVKGVILRILVFPDGLEDLRLTLKHISNMFGRDLYVSLMSQYVPVYRAKEFPEIARKLTKNEIREALKILHKEGFKNGWVQYG